jgi:hypothetical protein
MPVTGGNAPMGFYGSNDFTHSEGVPADAKRLKKRKPPAAVFALEGLGNFPTSSMWITECNTYTLLANHFELRKSPAFVRLVGTADALPTIRFLMFSAYSST